MSFRATYSTPMLRVADIERSTLFYGLLGFNTVDTDRCTPIGWARMHAEGGALMFLRTEQPVLPSAQGLILYMYTPDLVALREHLLGNGVQVPAISYPDHMLSGEVQLRDPDGYAIAVGHWGKSEQEAWEKRIAPQK